MERNVEKSKEESVFAATRTVLLIHAVIPIALSLLVICSANPRDYFKESRTELPGFTGFYVRLSDGARESVLFLPLLVGIFLVADGLTYHWLRRSAEKSWSKLWRWGILLIEAGVFLAVVLARARLMAFLTK